LIHFYKRQDKKEERICSALGHQLLKILYNASVIGFRFE